MIYPNDDEAMNYNSELHMYVLNVDYVKNELGEDLLATLDAYGDTIRSALPVRFLKRVSRIVYSFIYSYARSDVKSYVEYLLAKKPEYREAIQQALEEQCYFMLRNADLTTYNGVDLYKGSKMQVKREDTMSSLGKDILQNAGILYTGHYTVPLNFEAIKRSDY